MSKTNALGCLLILTLLPAAGCAVTAAPTETGATGLGSERVVTVSAFPVVRAAGGFGPDTLGTEGDSYASYTHEYFCAARVTLRTEDNPACTPGMQDCGATIERAITIERDCKRASATFTIEGVRMLGEGAVGGRGGLREDPLSGSCAAGFVLGRETSHPIAVTFPDAASCASLEARFVGKPDVTLALDLAVVTPTSAGFVAARETL